MSQEPPRILAVNPGSRYLGFAAFRGPELLDWGVRVIRAPSPRGKLRVGTVILRELIDRFQPEVLAVKGLHPHRSSTGLNQLASSIKKLSRQRRLHVQPYSIEQLKAALCAAEKTNKRLLAEQVAAQYPVLRHDFEKERANRNPYYLRMFEAVALGMVCYERREPFEVN